MKRATYLIVCLWSAVITSGCASIGKVFHHEPHSINVFDAEKIHPRSHLSDRHTTLSNKQAQAINQLYGQTIATEGELIAYYEARPRKGIYGESGNIFLVYVRGELSLLEVLVCTTHGQIDETLIQDNPVLNGRSAIPDEFLRQFIGRSLQDSWEVAKNSSDLVTLPSKIRPIASYPKTSEEVANAIRKVLVWAKILHIE